MVNVPPVRSSAVSRFDRAFVGQRRHRVAEGPQPHVAGIGHHRYDERLEVDVDGDAEVDAGMDDQLVVTDARR